LFGCRLACGVWCSAGFGVIWSAPKYLAVDCFAFRDEAPELSVEAIDVQATACRTLPHEPSGLTDDTSRPVVRGLLAKQTTDHGINNFVIESVQGGEPLLIRDQVPLVRQVIGLIDDAFAAVAADRHSVPLRRRTRV
jgi:hypothetical protein